MFKNQLTDRDLMRLISSEKDKKAWEVLYQRYHARLFSYFTRLLKGDTARSEDLLQDTFLKIFEKAWQYNPDYAVSTWIFTIATNHLKTQWRKESKPQEDIENIEAISSQISPEEATSKSIIKDQINYLLDQVSIEHKETYILRYQQGFSTKEVADVLDLSEGTVKSRLFKVTQLISKYFQSHKKKTS